MVYSFTEAYPNITRWIEERGWIELGADEHSTSLIRCLDEGGMVSASFLAPSALTVKKSFLFFVVRSGLYLILKQKPQIKQKTNSYDFQNTWA